MRFVRDSQKWRLGGILSPNVPSPVAVMVQGRAGDRAESSTATLFRPKLGNGEEEYFVCNSRRRRCLVGSSFPPPQQRRERVKSETAGSKVSRSNERLNNHYNSITSERASNKTMAMTKNECLGGRMRSRVQRQQRYASERDHDDLFSSLRKDTSDR